MYQDKIQDATSRAYYAKPFDVPQYEVRGFAYQGQEIVEITGKRFTVPEAYLILTAVVNAIAVASGESVEEVFSRIRDEIK